MSFDPTDLPVGGAPRQRGVHGGCLQRRRCAAPRRSARQRQGSDRQIRARGLGHDADRGGGVRGERAGEMGEGLPVVLGAGAQQQYMHGAFTPQPQTPQQLIGRAQVVVHRARLAAQDDRAGMFAQIALEAAPREQSGVLPVRRDQHERAGLAVGRARGVHQQAQRQCTAGGALALEKRQQRTQECFHVQAIMPARAVAPAAGGRSNYTYG